ncbi:MAG: hypothetical protein R3Y60_03100 [bacterium]
MKKYDYVFVLDYVSLLSGKFFSIYDIEVSDIRIVTPEMKKLNDLVRTEKNEFKRKEYVDIVSKINQFAENKKIFFLGENNERDVENKLLEVVIKNYYLKDILIISNEKEKIEKFLPLIPVYETFNKILDIGYITSMLGFYEFDKTNDALNCIVKEEYNDSELDDIDDLNDIE